MELITIATGSKGNCYLLKAADSVLVLELGVKLGALKKALNFNLSQVAGCIVSHGHQDHCKGVAEAISSGLTVYTGINSLEAFEPGRRIIKVPHEQRFSVGDFRVTFFPVHHDVNTCGYHIYHPECGNVIFITDTYYCDYTFADINHFIVEANYSQKILDYKFSSGSLHGFLRSRVMNSHMEIQNTKRLLLANDLDQVQNIVLIHLSDSNSNAADFTQQVEEITGRPTVVSVPGQVLNFNYPF